MDRARAESYGVLENDDAYEAIVSETIEQSFYESRPGRRPCKETMRRMGLCSTTGSEEICTICFDVHSYGDVICTLPCGDRFHWPCINRWFRDRNTCPLCRYALETDDDIYNCDLLHEQYKEFPKQVEKWDIAQPGHKLQSLHPISSEDFFRNPLKYHRPRRTYRLRSDIRALKDILITPKGFKSYNEFMESEWQKVERILSARVNKRDTVKSGGGRRARRRSTRNSRNVSSKSVDCSKRSVRR